MIALVILAAPLEQVYGPIRTFIIFVAAGELHWVAEGLLSCLCLLREV